jgi:NAD(P)-dependent dehydrogenase (short-subunit alcohol dehydrogenase family)
MPFSLSERVAIVTGGGRGIGAGIVGALSHEGAKVTIFDRNLDVRANALVEEVNAEGARWTKLYSVDVSRSVEVNDSVSQVLAELGQVDILVNNAGICPFQDIENITDELWNQTLNVNLSAMFFMVRALTPNFRARQRGVVINISTVSTEIATPHQVHYMAAKAGVNGLTRALAVALAPYRVGVNSVAPGGVETDINADRQGQMEAWERSRVPVGQGRWQPIPRTGTPDEIAQAVCFLASDAAHYIPGAIIPVDGGALIV